MTIATTTSKVIGHGNGITVAWNYSFLIPDSSSIEVIYTDATGAATVLTSSQYAVSGLGSSSGGSVTYPLSGSPIASGTTLTIMRVVPLTQPTRLTGQNSYYPDVVESALDRLEMQIQQVDEEAARTLVMGAGVDLTGVSLSLPAPAANQALGWDSTATKLTNLASIVSVAVSSYMQSLLGMTSAAALYAALGYPPQCQYPPYRNRLINGAMAVDQRKEGAALAATTSNVYAVDRWAFAASTTTAGTLTAQRVATSAPGGAQYCIRLARSAGVYAGALVLTQVIETANCYDLAGQTITLSFKARKGSAYAAALTAFIVSGTGVDEGVTLCTAGGWAGAATTSVVPTLTTNFATYTLTTTLGASVTELAVLFNTGNFSGTGGADDYLDITDVQIELGSTATQFEGRNLVQQLALCQRYYAKSFAAGTAPAQNVGISGAWYGAQIAGASTAQGLGTVRFPVLMRSNSPTVTTYNTSAANAQPRNSTTGTDFSAAATTATAAGGFGLTATSPGGSAAGNNWYVHWSAEAEL